MKQIALSQGKVAFIDNEDYDMLMQFTWHFSFSKRSYYGYALTNIFTTYGSNTIKMHQMIIGSVPKGFVIDHIDRNGINN